MDLNEINQNDDDIDSDEESPISPIYIKYYFISLAFFVFSLLVMIFGDNPEAPDIGFWQGIMILIIVPPVTALGAFIGLKVRNFLQPDFFLTSGAVETLKIKLFWKFGPQIIGWIIAVALLGNIIG